MDRAPDSERVPLGRAVNNVHVYVVDEHLSPVPLGAPGRDRLLRGLRRPRLRQRPRAHPAGLHGRSAPPGRAALPQRRLRPLAARTASWSSSAAGTPRSRSAASGSRSARSRTPCCGCPGSATARWWSPRRAGQSKHLVAFYSGPRPLEADVLRDRLGAVAARVHGPVGLPLAGEPAADRQRQDRPEGAARSPHVSSTTPTTDRPRRRATPQPSSGWPPRGRRCSASRRPRSAGDDHFFDRGGTSLSAVRARDRPGPCGVDLTRDVMPTTPSSPT